MRLWNDRRLRLDITRLGLEVLGITLALGLFAVNTGNNLLYVVFVLLLGLFLVSGWVSVRALGGLRVAKVEEGNIFARVKGGVRVQLEDDAPGRPRGLEVLLHLESAAAEPGFYAGGRGASPRVALHVVPERRGWHRLREVELRTRYPFGFMVKSHKVPMDQHLLVLPHPRATRWGKGGLGEEASPVSRPGAVSPEGVRPFRTGDSPRRVHWKRTAQRGEPWVRTLEDEAPLGIRLELDLLGWPPGEGFERELERLSGIILQARIHRQNVTLVLLGRHGRRVVEGVVPSWKSLALAQAEGGEASRPLAPVGAYSGDGGHP